jgi:protein-tyrosine phosphatase
MAEAIFRNLITEQGLDEEFEINSAGTYGYHTGELADTRARAELQKHGLETDHRAREIDYADLGQYDYILVMDRQNLADVQDLVRHAPKATAKIQLLRDYDLQEPGGEVGDPYYGANRFEQTYKMLERSLHNFLDTLQTG